MFIFGTTSFETWCAIRGSPPFKQLIGQAIEHIDIFSSGVEGKYDSRAAVEHDSSQAPMSEIQNGCVQV